METTIDRFGRIVIPKRVRDELGLDPGTVLEIERANRAVVLRVRQEAPDLVREDGVLVFAGEAVGDLEDAVENQRRRRARDAAAWSFR
jgi:AbrB family looped-hinge helix DNA binding protein